MSRRRCAGCGQWFLPDSRVKNHLYCSNVGCRRKRRREYQKKKLAEDEVYRANQADCQRRWREKNPDYYRGYRQSHPIYAQGNRDRQNERNKRLRVVIAKMDSIDQETTFKSGIYELSPLEGGVIAKMNSIQVRLDVISVCYGESPGAVTGKE